MSIKELIQHIADTYNIDDVLYILGKDPEWLLWRIRDELLAHRILFLKSNANTIKRRLDTYQKGNLKIKRVKNKTYYCIADESSGKQRYINVSNIKEAQNIAQRDYDLKYLKHVESEIKDY